MPHKLFEVLSRLLQLQHQNNRLLGPVARFQQVVALEKPLVRVVRIRVKHSDRIEVPHWRPRHHIETKRPEDGEVHGRVDLLHEARLLGSRPNPGTYGKRPDNPLHEEFARERQYDCVEGDKGQIPWSFSILRGGAWAPKCVYGYQGRRIGQRVREEDGAVQGIALRRVEEVDGEDADGEDQRVDPGVSEGEISPSAKEAACFPPL